jgi:hypothetical protein
MDHVDFMPLQVPRKPPDLAACLQIVETVESKLRNFIYTKAIDLGFQHPLAFESRNEYMAAPALQQQPR